MPRHFYDRFTIRTILRDLSGEGNGRRSMVPTQTFFARRKTRATSGGALRVNRVTSNVQNTPGKFDPACFQATDQAVRQVQRRISCKR